MGSTQDSAGVVVGNALFYNAAGVLVFMLCIVLGRPLQDIAYFTIQAASNGSGGGTRWKNRRWKRIRTSSRSP
jgi:hypothetical protein